MQSVQRFLGGISNDSTLIEALTMFCDSSSPGVPHTYVERNLYTLIPSGQEASMKTLKASVIGLNVVTLLLLSVGFAFAAQGQITEVNPSGIGAAEGVASDHIRVEPRSAKGIIVDVNPSGTVITPGRPGGNSDVNTGLSN